VIEQGDENNGLGVLLDNRHGHTISGWQVSGKETKGDSAGIWATGDPHLLYTKRRNTAAALNEGECRGYETKPQAETDLRNESETDK
jgi:hypothetical protein